MKKIEEGFHYLDKTKFKNEEELVDFYREVYYYIKKNLDLEERINTILESKHDLNEEDVVIVLAWKTNQEYISDCSNAYTAGKTLYMSTRLGDLYHKWTRVNKATMRIHHKSGDNFEVDWAGKTLPIYDSVIGAGENKYIVQEAFQKLYGDYPMPEKMPMPRDTNEWFKDWENPIRSEFCPYCTDYMTGDQKWLVCAKRSFSI